MLSVLLSFLIQSPAQIWAATHLTVMTYNVENLFDTVDDPGKDDYTFLPMSQKTSEYHKARCRAIEVKKWRNECYDLNWSKSVLKTKIRRLSGVIAQVNNGSGPDVLLLQEVENANVLNTLNQNLKKPYPTQVLLEGKDYRGIDVAILSRFPVDGTPSLHDVAIQPRNTAEANRSKDTRGILKATFKVAEEDFLTAFVVHFPSPRHPKEWRQAGIDKLNELAADVPASHTVVAGGDFNITTSEDVHNNVWAQLDSEWNVSHRTEDCGVRGTNYYHRKRSWSFLDSIVVRKQGAWMIQPGSCHSPNNHYSQKNRWLSPARFSPHRGVGVSDHWPLVVRLAKENSTVIAK